jgi:hypothetical protein
MICGRIGASSTIAMVESVIGSSSEMPSSARPACSPAISLYLERRFIAPVTSCSSPA